MIKNLTSSKGGAKASALAGPVVVGKSSLESEDVRKLRQDVLLIAQRLAGNTTQPHCSLVGELRSAVVESRSVNESHQSKCEVLEEILRKVSELDRVVLKQTEPINMESARPRRNSKTVDLFSLPTHFQLIDRLVDMHTQLKRPVIVHQHGGGERVIAASVTPSTDDDVLASLKATHDNQIRAVSENLNSVTLKFREVEKQLEITRAELAAVKSENEVRKQDIQLLKATQQQQPVPTPPPDNSAEMHRLNQLLAEVRNANRRLEEQLEISVSLEQRICNSLKLVANNIEMDKDITSDPGYVSAQESSNFSSALKCVLNGLQRKVNSCKDDVLAATTHANLVENELHSIRLEKQMLADDLSQSGLNYSTLRVAFSEMQTEMINLRLKLESAPDSSKSLASMESKFLLESNLAKAEIHRLNTIAQDLEARLNENDREKSSQQQHIMMLEEELQQYKVLTEKLKQRIRDISPLDKREFLDSFEEVMRDEMMAMKGAFEVKLKLAKSEVEALSKKHQQDIQKIRDASVLKR